MSNLDRIKDIISEELRLDVSNITPESHVVNDLNFDSLDSVQIVLELEQEFDIEVSDDEIDNIQTVQDIIDLVENLS
jgi:acyl carrier protein|tara:strand:+ start:17145 stop:17375 length:231 start_codon:yes stop_codon:yes gene_type:complete